MSNGFDKEVLFENIQHLLQEHDIKIGELEEKAGVSAGYISRATKDSKSKPGIDFIIGVAEQFKVSIDTLINVRLSEVTETEKYLISFYEKLMNDTSSDQLEWVKESEYMLNHLETDMDGFVWHPLFDEETFLEESESGYPEEVTRVVMSSASFGYKTAIHGECFYLELPNETRLYLMNISKSVYRVGDQSAFAIEAWLSNSKGQRSIGRTNDNSVLSDYVNNLYTMVAEFNKHPKLPNSLRNSIDSFMKGNWDSDDDKLPFDL